MVVLIQNSQESTRYYADAAPLQHYQLRVAYVVFEIFSYEFAKKHSNWKTRQQIALAAKGTKPFEIQRASDWYVGDVQISISDQKRHLTVICDVYQLTVWSRILENRSHGGFN